MEQGRAAESGCTLEKRKGQRDAGLFVSATILNEDADMIAVTVSFQFGEEFDPVRLQQIAQVARAKFEGLPGLRSKAFTIDAARRQAFNFYVWESEAAARAFFTPQAIEGVSKIYGVTPTIEYLVLATLVENPPLRQ
jgi:hypothetical protein